MIPFNPAALFICFRESLEAVIIVAVLLQFLERSLAVNEPLLLARLRRHVWAGALSGLAIAVAIGAALVFAVWVLKTEIVSGPESEMWEAAFETFAVVLQTYLAVKLMTFSGTSSITAKWENKLGRHLNRDASQQTLVSAPSSQNLNADEYAATDAASNVDSAPRASTFEYPFVILAFSVVLREGLESVIYLTGISAGESPSAIAVPGIIGIMGAITVGVLIHRFSARIELKSLMAISVTMMLVLSAGLASSVAGEVEEYVFEEIWDIDDGTTPVLWDISWCCDERTVPTFQVLSALVGYRAKPTVTTLTTYVVYWVIVAIWTLIARTSRSAKLRMARSREHQPQQHHIDVSTERTPLLTRP